MVNKLIDCDVFNQQLIGTRLSARDRNSDNPKGAMKLDETLRDLKKTGTRTPLHQAVLRGVTAELVAIVLDRGNELVDSVVSEYTHSTSLHSSSASGDHEMVETLLCLGATINAKTKDKSRTPLHLACRNNRCQVALALVREGADMHAIDSNGDAAVHLAAKDGYSEVVKVLLEASIHQHQSVNKTGLAPLHLAELRDSITTAEVLLKGAANVNTPTECEQKSTPLHLASEKGNKEMVVLLLEKDAAHTLQDTNGNTPLHIAARSGSNKVVKCLLKCGSDIIAETAFGKTPLTFAVDGGLEDTARILREEISRRQCASTHFEPVRTPVKGGQVTILWLDNVAKNVHRVSYTDLTKFQILEITGNGCSILIWCNIS